MKIKLESWGKTKKSKIYVVRDKGKIVTLRRLKGSGIKTKAQALGYFKQNNTLYKDRTKTKINNQTNVLANFVPGVYGGDIAKKKLRRKHQSYFVSGKIKIIKNGKSVWHTIVGTSFKQGTVGCLTNQECYDYAWRKFLTQLGEATGGSYDTDSGVNGLSKVKDLREGWTIYV